MIIEGLNKIIYENHLTKQASCLEMLVLMMTNNTEQMLLLLPCKLT